MTFCILAFASDGWIMAADRSELNFLGPIGNACRTREMATKILYDASVGVAACYAGDIASRSIAEDIITEIKQGLKCASQPGCRESVERIANQTLASERKRLGIRLGDYLRTVLIVLPCGHLWRIEGGEIVRAVHRDHRRGTICIGDTPNPAIFFPQRFHSAFDDDAKRTVDELKLLAAHTVLEAHEFNKTAVEGLDMLTFRQDKGFHLLEESELESLRRKSASVSAEIARLLF